MNKNYQYLKQRELVVVPELDIKKKELPQFRPPPAKIEILNSIKKQMENSAN